MLQQALSLWALLMVFIVPALWRFGRHLPTRRLLRRIAAMGVLVLYATGVIAYTFLPLPDNDVFVCPDGWGGTYPASSWDGVLTSPLPPTTACSTPFFDLRATDAAERAALRALWPAGPLSLGASFRTVLFAAFGTSLAIELTQLTGLWGYYDCAIRTFDAEDIFNNTLGAVLGWGALAAWQYRHTLPGQLRRLFGR